MSEAAVVAIIRLVQLSFYPVAGLICIYLGFKLFAQIPSQTSEGAFKSPKFGEASLKAAPGVFFALFGAAIIIWSLQKEINFKTSYEPQVKVSHDASSAELSSLSQGADPIKSSNLTAKDEGAGGSVKSGSENNSGGDNSSPSSLINASRSMTAGEFRKMYYGSSYAIDSNSGGRLAKPGGRVFDSPPKSIDRLSAGIGSCYSQSSGRC